MENFPEVSGLKRDDDFSIRVKENYAKQPLCIIHSEWKSLPRVFSVSQFVIDDTIMWCNEFEKKTISYIYIT